MLSAVRIADACSLSTGLSLFLGAPMVASATGVPQVRETAEGSGASRVPPERQPRRDARNFQDATPPELLAFVEADYPESARARGVTAEVILALVIDDDGTVAAVEILHDPGDGFGEAARAAALQFRFRPARIGEDRVPSRIEFRYRFDLPSPADHPESPETVGVSETSPVVPTPPAEAPEEVISLTATGLSSADERRRSAEAVHVVEIGDQARGLPDLGSVLERESAVALRRSGGLGSFSTVAMGGLGGTRVPVFYDGVPLELLGFSSGVSNVPLALVDRIEVYRGVTPARLGADALGGAIELVSPEGGDGFAGSLDYTAGSFDTHRLALGSGHRWTESGLFIRGYGFFDHSSNDYVIDAPVADARGRETSARVRRFHDGYQAGGGGVEFGLSQHNRIERLSVFAFGSSTNKEIQHRPMSADAPFGEPRTEQISAGGGLRYRHWWGKRMYGSVTAGYANLQGLSVDESACRYNWFGECVFTSGAPGEIGARDFRQKMSRNVGYGRALVQWDAHSRHSIRITLAPTGVRRTSKDLRELMTRVYDPLSGRRNVFKLVSGIEYESRWWKERLRNIAFVKDYVLALRADEPLPNETFRPLSRDEHHLGGGDALRVEVHPWVSLKASYEWTARMPEIDELFGDGMFIFENLDLRAERSHNFNTGVYLRTPTVVFGAMRARLDGFARLTRNLILLPAGGNTYQNIDRGRTLGVEGEWGWTSPGNWVDAYVNVMWQNLVNTSERGAFAQFRGDRLPNQPWLYTTMGVGVHWNDGFLDGDQLSVDWTYRYVHAFFLAWESQGLPSTKAVVAPQHVHALSLSYSVQAHRRSVRASIIVDNVADRANYDFFGIQKAGRAVYASVSVQM